MAAVSSRDCPAQVASVATRPAVADVRGDGGKPARARRRVVDVAQLVPVTPGFEQGLLGEVFSGVAVAGSAQADAHELRALIRCDGRRQEWCSLNHAGWRIKVQRLIGVHGPVSFPGIAA